MVKHTSYRGTVIDMELLKHQNQHAVAVGNAQMNARGDIIGRGGVVVKTREQLLEENERKLEKPEFLPVHHSESVMPQMDFEEQDNQNLFEDPNLNTQPVQEQQPQVVNEPVEKVTPRKRSKKED